ncbi:MAG: hypothetical protein O3B95_02270 [Chloroflexi bacterium]|nr:hypothetical protein [Chloroflexota bacterium]
MGPAIQLRVDYVYTLTSTPRFGRGICHYFSVQVQNSSLRRLRLPGLPRIWIDKRRRKLRRIQRDAMARIGISIAGAPMSGETTLCIAYMCPWAHACSSATPRPALVGQRNCLRKFPEDRRPGSGLSDVALDNLAQQREEGIRLESVTISVLDEFRPAGPTPSFTQKRPARPVYETGVRGKPFLPRPRAALTAEKIS